MRTRRLLALAGIVVFIGSCLFFVPAVKTTYDWRCNNRGCSQEYLCYYTLRTYGYASFTYWAFGVGGFLNNTGENHACPEIGGWSYSFNAAYSVEGL